MLLLVVVLERQLRAALKDPLLSEPLLAA